MQFEREPNRKNNSGLRKQHRSGIHTISADGKRHMHDGSDSVPNTISSGTPATCSRKKLMRRLIQFGLDEPSARLMSVGRSPEQPGMFHSYQAWKRNMDEMYEVIKNNGFKLPKKYVLPKAIEAAA